MFLTFSVAQLRAHIPPPAGALYSLARTRREKFRT